MTIEEQLRAKNITINISNQPSVNKEDLLFKAIQRGQYKEVRHLIEFDNINVNIRDCDGWTPLMVATDKNNINIVELLIKLGADLNLINSDGETALMLAAYNDTAEIGEILIFNGANSGIKDKYGRTAYDIAHEMYASSKANFFLKEKIPIEKLLKFFCEKHLKISYGTIINLYNLKKSFCMQFDIDLEMEYFEYLVQVVILAKNNNDYAVIMIAENVMKIIPSKNVIYGFLKKIFQNKKAGDVIKYSDIEDSFIQKFKIDATDINLRSLVNNVIMDKNEIKTTKYGDYVIIPNFQQTKEWLSKFFLSQKIGTLINISKIHELFMEEFFVSVNEYYFDEFIKKINKENPDKLIKRDDKIFINLNQIEINKILKNFLEHRNLDGFIVFSYEEMANVFKNEFDRDIKEHELNAFINDINDSSNNLGYLIERLPKGIYIRNPLQIENKTNSLIFDDTIPQVISKKKLNHIYAYINQINEYLQKQGLVLRQTTYNSEEYILTLDYKHYFDYFNSELVINEISECLKDIFYGKTIGFSCPIDEIISMQNKYDIEINMIDIKKAVERANLNLIENDRKIICDSCERNLKYVLAISEENAIKCPICDEPYSFNRINSHILEFHINTSSSPLVRVDMDYFSCKNCGEKKLKLFDLKSPDAIIGHITGKCKNSSFWKTKTKNTNTTENLKGTWPGFAFAKPASFFENTGQMFRDNGQFGAMSEEDYYGDGDY